MDAAITPPELQALHNNTPAPLVIDVRRDSAFLSAPDLIAGALRHDPEKIADWAGELPQATRIVVYTACTATKSARARPAHCENAVCRCSFSKAASKPGALPAAGLRPTLTTLPGNNREHRPANARRHTLR